MEFGLTLEQRQFDDSLRAFLADRLPMERLRALAEPGVGYDEDLWRGLTELGLHGLLVPERFGGAGLGILDAAVAAEALGYAAAPVPFTGSIVMATLAFMNSATRGTAGRIPAADRRRRIRFAVALPGLSGQTGSAITVHLTGGPAVRPRSPVSRMPGRPRISWFICGTAMPRSWRRAPRGIGTPCIAAWIARARCRT